MCYPVTFYHAKQVGAVRHAQAAVLGGPGVGLVLLEGETTAVAERELEAAPWWCVCHRLPGDYTDYTADVDYARRWGRPAIADIDYARRWGRPAR